MKYVNELSCIAKSKKSSHSCDLFANGCKLLTQNNCRCLLFTWNVQLYKCLTYITDEKCLKTFHLLVNLDRRGEVKVGVNQNYLEKKTFFLLLVYSIYTSSICRNIQKHTHNDTKTHVQKSLNHISVSIIVLEWVSKILDNVKHQRDVPGLA